MFKKIRDPGFGEKYSNKTKRLINPDGSFNVTRRGKSYSLSNVYQLLINLSIARFTLLLVAFYLFVNLFFASLYTIFSQNGLSGIDQDISFFLNAFFFSIQTFSSVGYGQISPTGLTSNFIGSAESLVGLVSYAILTGILYGRFSRPKARISFSKNAIIAPYKGGKSLQFRIVNDRSTQLMDLDAKAILMLVDKNHNRQYYTMDLEPSSIRFFPLSWTVVHPIEKGSPFYQKGADFYKETDGEILILIRGFDETFSQEVHTRSSYLLKDIVCNATFKSMFATDSEGEIILNLDKIDDYDTVKEK